MNYKHGLSKHPIGKIYYGMFHRDYADVTVCEEWQDLTAFYEWSMQNGWEDGLEINRKDNDQGYSPENCEWITGHMNRCKTKLIRANNTSGYRGVCWDEQSGKWRAAVTWKGVKKRLGSFTNTKQAALKRDAYILAKGYPMPMNFPQLAIVGG